MGGCALGSERFDGFWDGRLRKRTPPRFLKLTHSKVLRNGGVLSSRKQEMRSVFSLRKYKRKLAVGPVLSYSFPVNDTFALLNNETVLVLEIDGDDALVSFECGAEEWVETESLEIQPNFLQ